MAISTIGTKGLDQTGTALATVSGNVGIGTAPVVDGSYVTLAIGPTTAGASTSEIMLNCNGIVATKIKGDSDATRIYEQRDSILSFGVTNIERMYLDGSGNIGFGTVGGNLLNANGRPMLKQTGGILQVQQTVLTTVFSTTSTTYTPLTGLTVSITPSSTSSKIMLIAQVETGGPTGATYHAYFRLTRAGTAIAGAIGTYNATYSSNSANTCSFHFLNQNFREMTTVGTTYIDSPATTSSVTYGVQLQMQASGGTIFINTSAGSDTGYAPLGISTITAIEIAG